MGETLGFLLKTDTNSYTFAGLQASLMLSVIKFAQSTNIFP